MTKDDTRVNFLLALDRADISVTGWEAGFLDSCLGQFSFSKAQGDSIDRMMAKYADRIGFKAAACESLAQQAARAETDWNRQRSRFTASSLRRTPRQIVAPVRARNTDGTQ